MTEKTNKKNFPNLYTGTFIAVIALHAITGWALASVKTPEVAITEPVETPPLEIEIIKPIIKKPEVVEVQPQPKPVPEPKAEPKSEPVSTVAPQPEPVPQFKPEPETKPEPKPEPKVTPKPKPEKPLNTPQPKQEVQDKKVAEQQALAEQEQQARLNAQKQAELKAQEDARLQARKQARLEAQEQARLNAQEEARIEAVAEARRQAAEQARIKAEEAAKRQAAEQAASNEPVSFSGSDASWAREPNFEGLTHEALTLNLRFRVDKQGNISNITVKGSNDRRIIREAKRRLGRSKLNPFIQNGLPVTGIVNLSIAVRS
ncbi:energy transducer TonB [Psychrobacter sp. 1U2]|uniref:energy transducer TonB n=1 Tax=Psychrobacter sp. 1U2 TaxID=3453577 RepID=UPI003F475BF3